MGCASSLEEANGSKPHELITVITRRGDVIRPSGYLCEIELVKLQRHLEATKRASNTAPECPFQRWLDTLTDGSPDPIPIGISSLVMLTDTKPLEDEAGSPHASDFGRSSASLKTPQHNDTPIGFVDDDHDGAAWASLSQRQPSIVQ
jgi:hypothetical protein